MFQDIIKLPQNVRIAVSSQDVVDVSQDVKEEYQEDNVDGVISEDSQDTRKVVQDRFEEESYQDTSIRCEDSQEAVQDNLVVSEDKPETTTHNRLDIASRDNLSVFTEVFDENSQPSDKGD